MNFNNLGDFSKAVEKRPVDERMILKQADPQGHCEPVENRRGNLILSQ